MCSNLDIFDTNFNNVATAFSHTSATSAQLPNLKIDETLAVILDMELLRSKKKSGMTARLKIPAERLTGRGLATRQLNALFILESDNRDTTFCFSEVICSATSLFGREL